MKPKNKFQKKIVSLKGKLTPVNQEYKRQAEEKLFHKYFVNVRNRNNCLECGHKWKSKFSLFADRIIKPTCPSCGTKNLKHADGWETDKTEYNYWAILDVVEDFQVVRMFRTRKYMKRKQPVDYFHQEVMQHWIDKDGNMESLTALCQSMGYYYDSFIAGTPLEPRTSSRNHEMRCRIRPDFIAPNRKVLPIIRRNGYRGWFYGEAPHEFFSAILSEPMAETLLKAKQKSLFKKIAGMSVTNYDTIDCYWDSICIAMRNDYIVEDAGDWLDYLSILSDFDKDLHNPYYICPANFHEAHQRYVEKQRAKREAEDNERRRKNLQGAEEAYQKIKGKFFDLMIESGEIKIVPMKSVKEVIELGDKLHHCLGMRYAKKESSLILGAFIGDQPLEAIEFNLSKMEIIQARGLQNRSSKHHKLIVEAVNANVNQIAKRTKMKEVA